MNFTIYFPLDTYITPSGELDTFGQIHINVGDFAFPSNNWTDFGRIIVLHWLNNIQKILEGEVKEIECSFMDGPYSFYLKEVNKDLWEISAVERWFDGKKDGVTLEKLAQISSEQIVNEIFEAAEARRRFDEKNGKLNLLIQNENSFQTFQMAKENYFGNLN